MNQDEREELLGRVEKAEAAARESMIIAALYRDQIEDAVKLVERARMENHPDFLYGALSTVRIALVERNVRDWAKGWLAAWRMDVSWLQRSLSALQKIQSLAEQIDAADGSNNAALKMRIIAATKPPLVQHIPASISLDSVIEHSAASDDDN
jgi:hypothetical protein